MLDRYRVTDENTLADDPTTSRWLREQLNVTKQRDVLEAINDAEMLLAVLKSRWSHVGGDPSKKFHM